MQVGSQSTDIRVGQRMRSFFHVRPCRPLIGAFENDQLADEIVFVLSGKSWKLRITLGVLAVAFGARLYTALSRSLLIKSAPRRDERTLERPFCMNRT